MELEPEPQPLAEPEPAATCAEIGSSSSTHSGDEDSAADFSPDERFELDSSCFDSGSESDEGTTVPYIPVTQEDLERIERELSLVEQAAVLAENERTKKLLQKQKQAMEALGPASTKGTPIRQDSDKQWAQRWAKAGQAGKCDICGGGISDLSVGALTTHAKGKKHQKAKTTATAAKAAKAPQTIAPTTTGTSASQDDAQAVLTRLKGKFGADSKKWPSKKTQLVGAAGDQYNKTADLKSVVTQLRASGIVSGKGTKKNPFTWHIGSVQTETAVAFGIPAATATSAPTKSSGPKAGRHRGTVRRLNREMMIGEIMWTMPGGAGVSRAFMHENACQPGTWDALQNGCAVEFKAVEQSGKPQPYRAVAIEFVSLEAASAPTAGWSSSAATTSSSAAARPALKLATSERPQATLDELLDDDDDEEEDDASPPPEMEGVETCFCAILYFEKPNICQDRLGTNVGAVVNRTFLQG
jgi:hypothetical protein